MLNLLDESDVRLVDAQSQKVWLIRSEIIFFERIDDAATSKEPTKLPPKEIMTYNCFNESYKQVNRNQ